MCNTLKNSTGTIESKLYKKNGKRKLVVVFVQSDISWNTFSFFQVVPSGALQYWMICKDLFSFIDKYNYKANISLCRGVVSYSKKCSKNAKVWSSIILLQMGKE